MLTHGYECLLGCKPGSVCEKCQPAYMFFDRREHMRVQLTAVCVNHEGPAVCFIIVALNPIPSGAVALPLRALHPIDMVQ